MAFYDEFRDTGAGMRPGFNLKIAFKRLFQTPFDRRARHLARKTEQLRSLSDDQLASLGLRREDILFHVFTTKH